MAGQDCLPALEAKRFRIIGTSRLLGSQPNDPEIRERYIIEKAKKAGATWADASENEDLPKSLEDDKGITVFMRDKDNNGQLYIASYMVKGMIKEALKALASQTSNASTSGTLTLKNAAGKVDNLLFPQEVKLLLFRRDGSPILAPDGIIQRPLRAMTAQGERTSLAASEYVDEWQTEVTLELINNNGSKTSSGLTWNHVILALNYGKYKGLGQWRNAGNGSFGVCEV